MKGEWNETHALDGDMCRFCCHTGSGLTHINRIDKLCRFFRSFSSGFFHCAAALLKHTSNDCFVFLLLFPLWLFLVKRRTLISLLFFFCCGAKVACDCMRELWQKSLCAIAPGTLQCGMAILVIHKSWVDPLTIVRAAETASWTQRKHLTQLSSMFSLFADILRDDAPLFWRGISNTMCTLWPKREI